MTIGRSAGDGAEPIRLAPIAARASEPMNRLELEFRRMVEESRRTIEMLKDIRAKDMGRAAR